MPNAKILIVLLFSFALMGCPEKNVELEIIQIYNNSDRELLSVVTTEEIDVNPPDTLLPEFNISEPVFSGRTVVFNRLKEHEMVYVFILDPDTVNTYSWDIIRNENKILKRYGYTLAELKKIDYRIDYP